MQDTRGRSRDWKSLIFQGTSVVIVGTSVNEYAYAVGVENQAETFTS